MSAEPLGDGLSMRPVPSGSATMIEMSVASPSAQEQAIISTAMAVTRPKAKLGSWPNRR